MSDAQPRRAVAGVVDLTVRFGATTALDRVAFDLAPGEVVGLVGPNGAGKTTLLRVLATLLLPSAGRAEVGGFDVVLRPFEVRRRIGYLPDFAGLYQDMRVSEYLRFFADANGLDLDSRAEFVERALATSQLEERADDFIEQLSRGMRGRATRTVRASSSQTMAKVRLFVSAATVQSATTRAMTVPPASVTARPVAMVSPSQTRRPGWRS